MKSKNLENNEELSCFEVFTIHEVDYLLKVHHRLVRKLIKNKKLKDILIGNKYRITQETLSEILKIKFRS